MEIKAGNLSVVLNSYFITRKYRAKEHRHQYRDSHIDCFDVICKANICWDCWVLDFVNHPVCRKH